MSNLIGRILRPECSHCRQKELFGKNAIENLQKFKAIGEYEKIYGTYEHLCLTCWNKITKRKCSLCNASFDIFKNKKDELLQNVASLNILGELISNAKRICPSCHEKEERVQCGRCSGVFPKIKNQVDQYRGSGDIREFLYPYHPDYSDKWETLCPPCYEACSGSVEQVRKKLGQWVDGTKRESVQGHKTLRKLGSVEIMPDDRGCKEPDQVEDKLKLYSVQSGGNAFVKLHYQQRSEAHTVVL